MNDLSALTTDELMEQLDDYCGFDPYYADIRKAVFAEIQRRLKEHEPTKPAEKYMETVDGIEFYEIYDKCGRCGNRIFDGQKYCDNCGAEILR